MQIRSSSGWELISLPLPLIFWPITSITIIFCCYVFISLAFVITVITIITTSTIVGIITWNVLPTPIPRPSGARSLRPWQLDKEDGPSSLLQNGDLGWICLDTASTH